MDAWRNRRNAMDEAPRTTTRAAIVALFAHQHALSTAVDGSAVEIMTI
jgi:hypothetical protein